MQEMKLKPTAFDGKTCTKCGETKALDGFYSDKRARDGRASWCKPCFKAKQAAYEKDRYANDPAFREKKHAAYRRRWHEDPEFRARQIAMKTERVRNSPEQREKRRVRARRWREENPDRYFEQQEERLAKRSTRVRRIRKLLDHFEGRDAYLNHIAHSVDARPDAQGLQWLCRRIDTLVAEYVYGEL